MKCRIENLSMKKKGHAEWVIRNKGQELKDASKGIYFIEYIEASF